MTSPDRFSVVAPLPPHGAWRRALAVERAGGEPRAVVLAYAPPELMDEPARLAALVRDVEAAGRLHHPCAVPVLGTETVGDALAVVEAFRPGATLRALVDAAGRLPVGVAARIAADACGALARAHAIDAGEGQPLVHGAPSLERIAVGHDGAALVSGFGVAGGGSPLADVRGLGAVLHECLAGAPPAPGEAATSLPGVPAALSDLVARTLRDEAPPTAAELATALASATPLAAHAEVVAYAEAILPLGGEERAGAASPPARALPPGRAAETAPPRPATDPPVLRPAETAPAPVPGPTPGADDAAVFAAPPPPARRSRAPIFVVAACALVGFAAGFALARGPGVRPVAAAHVAQAQATVPPVPAEAPAEAPAIAVAEPPAAPAGAAEDRGAAPAEVPPAPPKAPAPPARREASRRAADEPAKAQVPARRAAAVAKGVLDVTAPADAEVLLDGRLIGRGSVRREVAVGPHHIEVRLGSARAAERFEVAPGETWTYEITPTP